MDVLISGAGIAGLTAAHWLRRYGFTPTVVERAPSLVVGGYKIDVRGSALEVLRRTGIHSAVVNAATDMKGALLVDRDGTVINQMTGADFGHRLDNDVEIVRGRLCQILLDACDGVEIRYGDAITAIDDGDNGAEVTFRDGGKRRFDLVVGADGLHSNVRQIVFGPEEGFLRDLGMYLCVFSVPNYLDLDRMEVQYSEIGRVAAMWSTREEAKAKACFGFVAQSPVGLRDRAEQEQTIARVYEGIGWEVPKLLELMPTADDWYFDIAAQVHMPEWTRGRVALAGDAGYCASPMSGQGSSLALVGAYVLAGELAAAKDDHRAAFAEYNRVMRPFVEANQEQGERSAAFMTSGTEEAAAELSGADVEATIDATTDRIAVAANAITLKDYVTR
jgi:2-polyprenyl-6-methoxyphenol hydroxylase-like FAD-dependent oxidoreductase